MFVYVLLCRVKTIHSADYKNSQVLNILRKNVEIFKYNDRAKDNPRSFDAFAHMSAHIIIIN